jgi:hypothetical protein
MQKISILQKQEDSLESYNDTILNELNEIKKMMETDGTDNNEFR